MNPHNPDRANKSTKGQSTYIPRAKNKYEAGPITSSIWTPGSYIPGDGEVRQLQRPGSDRAATLPSRGYRT